jgi:hypothetical protein
VLREYHEDQQREDLRQLIAFLQLDTRTRTLTQAEGSTHASQRLRDLRNKLSRKVRTWTNR